MQSDGGNSGSVREPLDEVVRDVKHTTCIVVGGGPGGLMLGLLLARRGVAVTVLEAHPTFDRDFRGDTIHPGILEILDQIGLADDLHALPHVKMFGPTFPTASGPVMPFDFRQVLHTKFPYILWMAQPLFLAYLAEKARKYPTFRIVMGASVGRLVEEGRLIRGVRYRADDGWHEVRGVLTVGADGRFSRVRKLAGIPPVTMPSPVELIWFRLPRLPDGPEGTGVISPRFGRRRALLMIDRIDHWQVGCFILAGEYPALRAAGLEAFRRTVIELEPGFRSAVATLTDWHQLSLLAVTSSRCRRWYRPGLLLIGDAAHTMTPAAGAGIKYAIEDAVVAVNVLSGPLLAGMVRLPDLAEVQRRRIWPTRIIQAFGGIGLGQLGRMLRSGKGFRFPRGMLLVWRLPLVRNLLARMLAIGLWRVRLER